MKEVSEDVESKKQEGVCVCVRTCTFCCLCDANDDISQESPPSIPGVTVVLCKAVVTPGMGGAITWEGVCVFVCIRLEAFLLMTYRPKKLTSYSDVQPLGVCQYPLFVHQNGM